MGYVNQGGDKYGEINCALCTVAAIFDTNTAEIARLLKVNQSEGVFGHVHRKKNDIPNLAVTHKDYDTGENLQQDFNGIKDFVSALRKHMKQPVYVSQGGSFATPVPLDIQIKLMLSYPVGTQFAVWAYIDEMKGLGAHWNYAVRTDSGAEFRDYQYNTSEENPPEKSDHFIPPKGGGSAAEYKRGVVLTFRGAALKMPYEK